jgi:hypothetical protein
VVVVVGGLTVVVVVGGFSVVVVADVVGFVAEIISAYCYCIR